MSRCHCSSVMRWAGAIVVVIAALETHTSTSGCSRDRVARQVDPQVAALVAVERHDVHPVVAQALRDRGADAHAPRR